MGEVRQGCLDQYQQEPQEQKAGTQDNTLPKASPELKAMGQRAEDRNLAGFPFHQVLEQERRGSEAIACTFWIT